MKARFPADEAKAVAREILAVLKPACLDPWLKVAGSLRRRKADVGDVEFVYVPAIGMVPDGLFQREGNLADEALNSLVLSGIIAPRLTIKGTAVWGQKNKLAVHLATGIPLDFFSTSVPCFWNYLVCRTGSKETNTALAMSAQERGLKWHPYSLGFEVINFAQATLALKDHGATLTHQGQHIQARNEQDVFALAGLPYLEPHAR